MQASVKKLETLNPGSKNVEILKHNLEILIQKKLTEFPGVKKLIVNAEISIVAGKECLYVASTDFQQSDEVCSLSGSKSNAVYQVVQYILESSE